MNSIIKWIENWLASQCDGDWEHEYGIKIYTTSNPGWTILIDLEYTGIENLNIDVGTIEKGEDDWFFYHIKNKKFTASGDTSKLEFLLMQFKEIAESHTV